MPARTAFSYKGIQKNILLKSFTTTRVGGPARYFFRAHSEEALRKVLEHAVTTGMPWIVVGEGSNIIPDDKGYRGLVIKNEIKGFEVHGRSVHVGAGENLLKFIHAMNNLGCQGLETMAGIPGSVGGAIYGCAGAYGSEIKDCLVRVKILEVLDRETHVRWISRRMCNFRYRESVFKIKKNWIILAAEFRFNRETPSKLIKISQNTIRVRLEKYSPKMKCPGSFFKNIVLASLAPRKRTALLSDMKKGIAKYGKVPTGYLLEAVGAKGMRQGDICVAEHHGNLIYNTGKGTARDVERLARALKKKVRGRFGIAIEEEVQYI